MACENGHSKIAEMLIQKSAELNIDLNAKHRILYLQKLKIHLTRFDPKISYEFSKFVEKYVFPFIFEKSEFLLKVKGK